MNSKISILGCGWLGTPLGVELIKKNYTVRGSTQTVNKIEPLKSIGIEPFLIGIEKLKDCNLSFFDSSILVITITNKNILHFQNLIKNINKSRIEKVIFISSTSVYNNNNKTVTELDATNDSLLNQIENLFLKSSQFKTTIIRFGGLFGYNRKPGNFIKPPYIIKNPEGFVNLIHQDDCIQIIKEIISQNIWGETINACSSNHPKRNDFYSKEVLRIQGVKPEAEKNSLNEYKIISNEKLKRILNYQFKFDDLMRLP